MRRLPDPEGGINMSVRTLIVDQAALAPRLARFLRELSPEVEIVGCFSSEAEASEFLSREHADLMFWEVCPGTVDCLRRLRGRGVTAALVLLLSASDGALLEPAMALGVSDCILRPCDPVRLRYALHCSLERLQILHSCPALSQNVLDRLLRHALDQLCSDAELPKGLSARTLSTLEQLMRAQPAAEHTCESLAAFSGFSRVTVRHYLNYLVDAGKATCRIDYSTGGRPRVIYHLC